jgi:plastocyanin
VRYLAVGLTAIVLASGCTSRTDARDVTGPYVVTAIDYHFHDAHPSMPIALDRALEFSNQGSNPHNVTIEGTTFDRTFQPGTRFSIDPISSVLPEPGRYAFFCKLHADRGMSGVLVITSR